MSLDMSAEDVSGYLFKYSRRRSSFGSAFNKYQRRWFHLTQSDRTLRYWKTSERALKAASGGICIKGCRLTLDEEQDSRYRKFTLVAEERVLTLRANSDEERKLWVSALLAAGAYQSGQPQPPLAQTGAGQTFVPVPSGLKPGQIFVVQLPSGDGASERIDIRVPDSTTKRIEVLVPGRNSSTAPGPPAESEGAAGDSGRASSCQGDTAWTLCRQFEVSLYKPSHRSLGLALAPSRAGHLTITDISAGGAAEAGAEALQHGDMLVSLNGEPLTSDPDDFVGRIAREGRGVVEEDGVAAVSWNVVNPSGAPLSSAPSRVGGMAAGSALQAAGCRLPAVDDEEREAIRLLMSGADEMGVEMPMYLHAAELDLCDDDGGVLEADVEEGEQQQRPSSAAVGWRVV